MAKQCRHAIFSYMNVELNPASQFQLVVVVKINLWFKLSKFFNVMYGTVDDGALQDTMYIIECGCTISRARRVSLVDVLARIHTYNLNAQ